MKHLKLLLTLPLAWAFTYNVSADELYVNQINKPQENGELRIGIEEAFSFEIRSEGLVPGGNEIEFGLIYDDEMLDTLAYEFENALDSGDTEEIDFYSQIPGDVVEGEGNYCIAAIDDSYGSGDTLCIDVVDYVSIEVDFEVVGIDPEDGSFIEKGEPTDFTVTVRNSGPDDFHGEARLGLIFSFFDTDDVQETGDFDDATPIGTIPASIVFSEDQSLENGEQGGFTLQGIQIPDEGPDNLALIVQLVVSDLVDPDMENNLAMANYSTATSIEEMKEANNDLKVYPNPAQSNQDITLEVELNNATESSFEIYDLTGKKVYEQSYNLSAGNNEVTVQSDVLDSGLYIYRLNDGESSIDGKLIIE